jgi:hypothetical protein
MRPFSLISLIHFAWQLSHLPGMRHTCEDQENFIIHPKYDD